MLKNKLLEYLKEETEKLNRDSILEKFTSQYIANIFGVKRNTISHYINQMIENGQVIKINTRPVYFIHKDTFESRFFETNKLVYESVNDLFNESGKKDLFNNLIGARGSLKNAIDKIKTSILYPTTNGLPIMLYGPTGVGKSYTASLIYKFCIEQELIKKDAPFISFNCAQYFNNPELLSSNLFGYVKGAFTGADRNQAGIIENANGGVLFLDEVHRLNNEGQEKLFTFMDSGLIRRMGESSGWHKSDVRLIFATTENLKENFLATFLRRIPITINIPGLEEREKIEKEQFIISFFIEESKTFNKSIKLSKRVFEILVNFKYSGNIGELKNTIKYICASSYAKKRELDEVVIKLRDIPEWLLSESSKLNEFKIKKNDEVIITPNIKFDEIFCKENEDEVLILDSYKCMFKLYKSYLKNNDVKDFEEKIFILINTLIDKLIYKKESINEDTMLGFINSSLQEIFKHLEYSFGIKNNGNVVYIIANFLYSKSYEKLTWNKEERTLLQGLHKYILESNKEEYKLVLEISNLIANKLDFKLLKEDEIFLSFYIKSMKLINNNKTIKAIILAHGYSTASSIRNVVNRLLGRNVLDSIDMPYDVGIKEIKNQLINYLKNNDISNGLIILVDMGSLKEIYMEIKDYVNHPVGIITNVSTQMALYIGDLLNKELYLEEIIEKVKKSINTEYKMIYPEKVKEKAIITSCITGIGTAKQLQKLLEKSIPKELDIKILACDFDRLKNQGVKDELFRVYDIIAIISTLNPEVECIDYISLDDLISGRGEDRMQRIFKDITDEETIIEINNNLIRNFSLESIVSSVTILDTNKVLENIESCLKNLELLLGERIPNSKKVTLYIHISCLIERLIRQKPINNYVNVESFKQCQKDMIKMIKKSFCGIEDIYNVKINIEEIGYIYDIISAKIDDFNEL